MTGTWEQRLQNLAEGGVPWDMPTRFELANALESLRQVLDAASKDTGIDGDAGNAARERFATSAAEIGEHITYLREHVNGRLIDANEVRRRARDSAASLPPGEMNGNQEAMVRGAAAGASIVFGPVAFLAGEGASRAINGYMASQREEAARTAVETHSGEMDAVKLDPPPTFSSVVISGTALPPTKTEVPEGGYGSQQRSFESYPDWNVSGGGPGGGNGGGEIALPPGGGGGGGGGGIQPPPSEYGPFPNSPGQTPGGQPPIDIGNVPPDPTPDGPISGSPTLPGGIPTAPGGGGGLVGSPGGPGAGLGSGLGAGVIAGGGGALALGRIGGGAGAPGVPGGRLFGGPAGGSVGAGGAGGARSGGLLGRPGAGGGLGTRGVGGLGAAGTGSANSTARGAGARASGLGAAGTRAGGIGGAGGSTTGASGGRAGAANGRPGTGAAGAGRSGAAAASGRTAGAGTRGVGGMGGPGSRSERKKDEARGLAGPIAPRMEDDEEIGPRSENAQAGGRDE
ncbi:hypothetical protein AB0O16_02030 [Microbacterium sp. NPDC089180]|uniref:hypothetical protein n=1 Tax=unclassified Microbacterium TaxID=2609290 RepID=UPI00342B47C5